MSAALNLSDELVSSLAEEAKRHDLSWQQWAVLVLDDSRMLSNDRQWSELNRRRIELIHAKYDRGLECHEDRELIALQAAAAQRLSTLDAGRLRWLEEQEQLVASLD